MGCYDILKGCEIVVGGVNGKGVLRCGGRSRREGEGKCERDDMGRCGFYHFERVFIFTPKKQLKGNNKK